MYITMARRANVQSLLSNRHPSRIPSSGIHKAHPLKNKARPDSFAKIEQKMKLGMMHDWSSFPAYHKVNTGGGGEKLEATVQWTL